jgi:hypothetical protein
LFGFFPNPVRGLADSIDVSRQTHRGMDFAFTLSTDDAATR